jgi:hypothetical protein
VLYNNYKSRCVPNVPQLYQMREMIRKKHYSIQYSERNMGDWGI